MAKFKIAKGTRDRSFPVYAWNSGTGSPYGGLLYNTVGFSGEYRREYQSTWQNITLNSGALGTYISGGFIIDGGLVGRYQFSPPNEVFATGNDRWAEICLYGPANLLPILCEVELDEVDYQNKTNFGVTNISGAVQSTGPVFAAVTGYATNMDPGTYVLQTPSWKLKTDPVGGAVVSGKPNVTLSPNDITGPLTVFVTGYNSASNPASLILVNSNNKIDTNSFGQVVMSGSVTVSTGSLAGLQVTVSGYTAGNSPATLILTNPTYKILTTQYGETVISGGNLSAAITGQLNVLVTGYTSAANPATLTLVNPANKILTDVNGYIVPSGKPYVSLLTTDISGPLSATVSGYAVGRDPATQVLANTGYKLVTSLSGAVNLNFDQAVPYTNTAQSVGDSLNAMRAAGFGKWVMNTGSLTLTLYGGDSTTVVRVFNLDSVEIPTTRT